MAKMHQLLAVEADLKNAYEKIMAESHATFTKRQEHFRGLQRELKMFDADEPAPPIERKALDTTVNKRIDYQTPFVVRYLDAVLQKELTNQKAVADIVIDGKIIAKDLPAPFLLGLEKHLKNLRKIYEVIPTLPPGIVWELDPETGEGIYRRKYPEEKFKTEQTIVAQVLYDATKEHPAQVDKIAETKNIGLYVRNEWSGMLTPATKAKLLDRIDKATIAVKKARQKANSTEIVKGEVGKHLFDFING